MVQQEAIASVLATSMGCVLFLLDASSQANSAGFWARARQGRGLLPEVARLAAAHDLFHWIIILDGTFRIEFLLGNPPPPPTLPSARRFEFVLRAPTGSLVLRSPDASVPALRVEPGTYHGSLDWNYAAESEHSGIESADDYPSGEGPDGRVYLRRVS
jgi:hypothetical protein